MTPLSQSLDKVDNIHATMINIYILKNSQFYHNPDYVRERTQLFVLKDSNPNCGVPVL